MRKSIYKLVAVSFLGMVSSAFAQENDSAGKVGINTETPNATLEIKAKTTDGSKIEGLKTPQLTGDALKEMTKLLTAGNDGLVVFVTTAVTTPDASTSAVIVPGYYRFNFRENTNGLTDSSIEGTPKIYTAKSWIRLDATGLEFVVENGKGGRRLVGADISKYGDIGILAVDLSHQTGSTDGIALNTNVTVPIPKLEGATGDYSFVANRDNTASGQRASAFGFRTIAQGSTSFAAGNSNVAEGNQSATFGYQNYAKGTNSVTFGQENFAEAVNTAVFGTKNSAESPYSVVIGQNSKVTVTNKGLNTNEGLLKSRNSVAMGTNVTITDSPNSLAYGANTTITNSQNAFAGGGGTTQIINGNSSVALGNDVQVSGNGSIGLGAVVRVNGTNSVAIGKEAKAQGSGGVAIGYGASAGANEVAIGSTSSTIILGKLKTETITENRACTENGRLSYNGTDFLGCTGGKWVKLNN